MTIEYSYDQVYESSIKYFNGDEFASKVFVDKYALQNLDGKYLEHTPADMHHRLSKEFARIEQKYPNPLSEDEIFILLDCFKYIVPQGSPMSAIGNPFQVQSLSNCFVVQGVHTDKLDSYGGIMLADQEIAQIMKRRGGVGLDISGIRPKDMSTNNAAKTTDGIGVFMSRFSNTCREVAQCLDGDTLILTINGIKKISDIQIGDEVWTQKKWVPVEKVLKNKKKVIKLITEYGKELIASSDHIIHTINGEKKISDLKIGDSITQIIGTGWQGKDIELSKYEYEKKGFNQSNRLHQNITLPTILSKDFAYLLGQMYGDGCIEKHNNINSTICIALSDDWQEITNKINILTKKVFNIPISIKNKTGEKCSRGRISSRELISYLEANNLLKQKAEDIIFPTQLLEAKADILFSFISGFFDADGCVQQSKKQYKFSSIQKNFLLTIQNILMSFGVVAKLHTEIRGKKIGQENWKDLYSLTINGNTSQSIFKQLMQESIKISETNFASKKQDWTKSYYKIGDFNSKSSRHSYIIDNNQYISYSTLERVKQDLKIEAPTFLFQDIIKSISEESDQETDVYDLVLPSEHLFFANGLYVHNSDVVLL